MKPNARKLRFETLLIHGGTESGPAGAATGIETRALRMERHCENSLKLDSFLSGNAKVKWVNYPGLPDSPYHEVANVQDGYQVEFLYLMGGGR